MNPSDLILKQMEDSQRLTKQLDLYRQSDLQRIAESFAVSNPFRELQGIASQINFPRNYIDPSRLYEMTRVASGQLEALKLSMAAAGQSFEALRKATEIPDSIRLMQEHAASFERQFRLTTQQDFAKLAEMASSIKVPTWSDDLTRMGLNLERQLQSIRDPFIQMQDSLKSLRGFSELSAIGAAVKIAGPFDTRLVENLRRDLGDWRDTEVDASDLLDDPEGRVAAYEEHGFNAELTDFPAKGFEGALTVTGIDLGVVSEALAPPPAEMVPVFNVHAYQWLFVLERQLREFILKCLTEAGNGNWEARLPSGMRDKWQEKKTKALSAGEADQPLINYADFTDYNDIILGAANWRDCFKGTFKREEAVREGFNRLRPVRLVTAHMRVMTNEEWLILNLEVRRILRAIGVQV